MLKKIAFGLIGLVVLLLIAGQFLWSNLDSYVKQAIVTYGSQATQATVHLDSVKLSLTTGEGALKGLSVSNPSGFPSGEAINLDSVSVKIDTSSVTGTGPVVINDITIEKPKVLYEVAGGGANNLDTLSQNARSYAASYEPAPKEKSSKGATTNEAASPVDSAGVKNGGRKMIIDSLTITGGDVAVIHPLLQGRKVSTTLPDIHLKDIGRKEGGATPAEITHLIISEITKSATEAAAKSVTRGLGNITNSGGKIGGKVKGLFGR